MPMPTVLHSKTKTKQKKSNPNKAIMEEEELVVVGVVVVVVVVIEALSLLKHRLLRISVHILQCTNIVSRTEALDDKKF